MRHITLITTGGTIEKTYDEMTGELTNRQSIVGRMLEHLRLEATLVHIVELMRKDSLHMTDDDRDLVRRTIEAQPARHVLVTHGTDTMVETASAIARGVADKTIVLTGAMIPYAFGSSDGLFNLGSALSFVQVLPAGVYIAMNGQHFAWNKVRKNKQTGVFEAI